MRNELLMSIEKLPFFHISLLVMSRESALVAHYYIFITKVAIESDVFDCF